MTLRGLMRILGLRGRMRNFRTETFLKDMMEILFLVGFILHNIEEFLWLPRWSRRAKYFSREFSVAGFRRAVIAVTLIGCSITAQYFVFSPKSSVSVYVYFGFVAMMMGNVVFPHGIVTILERRYMPGTATGLFVIFPIGAYLLEEGIESGRDVFMIFFFFTLLSVSMLLLIRFFTRRRNVCEKLSQN